MQRFISLCLSPYVRTSFVNVVSLSSEAPLASVLYYFSNINEFKINNIAFCTKEFAIVFVVHHITESHALFHSLDFLPFVYCKNFQKA